MQNFRSWSPEMVPDRGSTCLGLEYFCFEGDGLWTATDEDLIALAKREIDHDRPVRAGRRRRRLRRAPGKGLSGLRRRLCATTSRRSACELERDYPTLHLVGRNGMHKYNNQDHAMMTAMLTVRNILAGERVYDVWQVNEDAEYHESRLCGRRRGAEQRAPGAEAGCRLSSVSCAPDRRISRRCRPGTGRAEHAVEGPCSASGKQRTSSPATRAPAAAGAAKRARRIGRCGVAET